MILIALPAISGGATVKPKLKSYTAAPAQTRATSPTPTTEPPLHGTNPHGQGTVATVDVDPSANRPFSDDMTGKTDSEDVVVGRARGEQRADGSYHGHITIAALFGNEILPGADTVAGQSVDTDILAPLAGLCTSTGICLSGVHVTSATTATGSKNRFSLLDGTIGAVAAPAPAVRIGIATSNGDIGITGTNGECQTAHGDSNVANVDVGGTTASAATSSSDTTACRDQAPVQKNSSSVIQLGSGGVAVPPIIPAGCESGAPDSVGGVPPLLVIVCNADDSSATGGKQATDPYGVRDALDVYVGAVGTAAIAKISTSASESLARAPAAAATPRAPTPPAATPPATPPAPPATAPADDQGQGDPGPGPDDPDAGPDNRPAPQNLSGSQLPFTGTDIVGLGLAGAILLAAGLALRRRELGS